MASNNQVIKKLSSYERDYNKFRRIFESDGVVDDGEQEVLDSIEAMIKTIRTELSDRDDVVQTATAEAPKRKGRKRRTKTGNVDFFLTDFETGEELSSATITVAGKSMSGLHFGRFRDVPAGNQRYSVTADRYEKQSGRVRVRAGKNAALVIKLKRVPVTAGEKMAISQMIIQSATDLAQSARINALFFGRQVVSACRAFEVYSKPKLDDFDDELKAGDLLAPLVNIATGGVAGAMVNAVNDTVGRYVVEQVTKLGNDSFVGRSKAVGRSSTDLKKAVGALILGANDMATKIEGVVNKAIVPRCDDVTRHVNAGIRIEGDLLAFIHPFIRATTSEVDKQLEKQFSVPGPKRSKQTQLRIYRGMVTEFERKLILARTSSQTKMQWAVTGVPSDVHRAAELRGRAAMKQRAEEIKNDS